MTGTESIVRITRNFLKTNPEVGKSCISVNTGYYLLTNKVHERERHLSKLRLGNITVSFDTLTSRA